MGEHETVSYVSSNQRIENNQNITIHNNRSKNRAETEQSGGKKRRSESNLHLFDHFGAEVGGRRRQPVVAACRHIDLGAGKMRGERFVDL